MAQSKSSKKLFNMAYGLGAAVVILGALFQILHWEYGNEMLMVGMIVEAIVFAISAFEPVEDELDWTKGLSRIGRRRNGGRKPRVVVSKARQFTPRG